MDADLQYISYAMILVCSYMIGCIPFGLILTRIAGHGDIRKIGSGNIGATNVLRTGNKTLALLTLLLDGGKGAVAVLLAAGTYPELMSLAGLAVMLGHLFPIWLRFKGGKGVATTVGVLLALAWPVGLMVMGIWIAAILITRYSSVAALIAIGLSPALCYIYGHDELIWLCLVILCFVTGKHENNIKRLLKGKEPKIGK